VEPPVSEPLVPPVEVPVVPADDVPPVVTGRVVPPRLESPVLDKPPAAVPPVADVPPRVPPVPEGVLVSLLAPPDEPAVPVLVLDEARVSEPPVSEPPPPELLVLEPPALLAPLLVAPPEDVPLLSVPLEPPEPLLQPADSKAKHKGTHDSTETRKLGARRRWFFIISAFLLQRSVESAVQRGGLGLGAR